VLTLMLRTKTILSECESARQRVCLRAQRAPDRALVDVMASMLADLVKKNRRFRIKNMGNRSDLTSVTHQVGSAAPMWA
jgi:hypothetical protein